MAIYDMGPWATAAEWALVDRLGREIGWATGEFAGTVTHGGSLANLTALLTARNVMLGDSWKRGLTGRSRPPALVVHADTHYSVSRTAGLLGLGTDHVVRVGLDARRRMDPERLDDALRDLRRGDRPVVAVVACSCSTPIGAFDPLSELADVCRRHEVWLHVDAAHGGSACLSPRYRHLVRGLERADSIVWDAHKMLFMPALCAFVLYRDKAHRFEAFQQEAPYLFDPSAPGLAEFDSGLRTVECTKRAAAFGLWGIWSLYGRQLFTDLVDVTFGLGKTFFEKLSAAPISSRCTSPNATLSRSATSPQRCAELPTGRWASSNWHSDVVSSSRVSSISSRHNSTVSALRTTIINPLTTPDHLDQLLDTIRRRGRELVDAGDWGV